MKALAGALVILAASACFGLGAVAIAISSMEFSTNDTGMVVGTIVWGIGALLLLIGLFVLNRGWKSE